MCGIAGYISMSKARPTKESIEKMFQEIQNRGRDASGYSYIEGDEIYVVKAPMLVKELLQEENWGTIKKMPHSMILHTRAGTQGSEKDNENNHPIFHEQRAMVHNGVIHNEEDFDVPATEVDSKAIVRSWVQNDEDIEKVFASLEGSFAVAMLNIDKPEKLILFRHNNPIEVLYDSRKRILYFASTTLAVSKVKDLKNQTKASKGFLLKNRYYSIDFPNDSFWELNTTEGLANTIEDLKAKVRTYTKTSYTPAHHTTNYEDPNWWRRKYGNNDYYYGQDDDDFGYNRLPAKTKSEKPDDVGDLFLEHLEPKSKAAYDNVNLHLAESSYQVIPCKHCKSPTIVNVEIKQKTQSCFQCNNINIVGANYVN